MIGQVAPLKDTLKKLKTLTDQAYHIGKPEERDARLLADMQRKYAEAAS